MRRRLTLLLLVAFALSAMAERVAEQDARQVANHYLGLPTANSLRRVRMNQEAANMGRSAAEQTDAAYYVFQNEDGNGWVMIAADDVAHPVLAYSTTGHFSAENQPSNIRVWLQQLEKEITAARDMAPTDAISEEWAALRRLPAQVRQVAEAVVGPLVTSRWDQDSPYWNLCPGSGSSKAYTGCVATAMAQVMNYWEWPKQGTGSHSYRPVSGYTRAGTPIYSTQYGTQTADFGATTYDWDNMIDSYSGSYTEEQALAVATLMYHCGVAVDMQYGDSNSDGSGAYTISYDGELGEACAEDALKTYFGYKSTIRGVKKDGYSEYGHEYLRSWTDAEWNAMIKAELDAHRPIMYDGAGTAGGHSFILDGYDTNDMYHFNWGWSGENDGFYRLSALNPGSGGAGGGSYSFSQDQAMIIGIEPDRPTWDIQMYAEAEFESLSVEAGGIVRFSASISNNGSEDVELTLYCLIYNDDYSVVERAATAEGTLQAGYHHDWSGVEYALPETIGVGDYHIGFFYTPKDGSLTQVDTTMYASLFNLRIYQSAAIEMYCDFQLKSGTWTTGDPVTIYFQIMNEAEREFGGKLRLSLVGEDGQRKEFGELLFTGEQVLAQDNGAEVQFATVLDCAEGDYKMIAEFEYDDDTEWTVVGSTNYRSAVNVHIDKYVAPSILADQYEHNDSEEQAFTIASRYKEQVSTENANIHNETDVDYYKIKLLSGYDYTLDVKLYHAVNNNKYTVKVDCQYAIDQKWVNTRINTSGKIEVTDGGEVLLVIAPLNAGDIGTYKLQVSMQQREHTNGLTNTMTDVMVYPNPTSDYIVISSDAELHTQIISASGAAVLQTTDKHIDVSQLPRGEYVLISKGAEGDIIKKIIKK